MLVILVPVLFGMLGFAVDLGMLYSVRGELRSAAESIALAAAQQLNGTDAAADRAVAAGLQTVEETSGFGNRYYFHGYPVGGSAGTFTSTISDPLYYSALADALANGGGEVGGPQARHIRINVTGQTQLVFWSLLPVVSDRNIAVMATAVAGISAPLCTACGIESFTVGAIDPTETANFGYVIGNKYSFYFDCTGAAPTILAGAVQSVPYLLLNRYNPDAATFTNESTQAFRQLAGGLPGSTNSALACFRINNTETIWATAIVSACTSNNPVPQAVAAALCGIYARFDNTTPLVCSGIPEIETLATAYQPDSDVMDYDTYTDYTGNSRRIITIPIVETLSDQSAMTVVGFRQFLLIPDQGSTVTSPGDVSGRFVAMYLGAVAPVKQGRFDCQVASGPGKVVLHQ